MSKSSRKTRKAVRQQMIQRRAVLRRLELTWNVLQLVNAAVGLAMGFWFLYAPAKSHLSVREQRVYDLSMLVLVVPVMYLSSLGRKAVREADKATEEQGILLRMKAVQYGIIGAVILAAWGISCGLRTTGADQWVVTALADIFNFTAERSVGFLKWLVNAAITGAIGNAAYALLTRALKRNRDK